MAVVSIMVPRLVIPAPRCSVPSRTSAFQPSRGKFSHPPLQASSSKTGLVGTSDYCEKETIGAQKGVCDRNKCGVEEKPRRWAVEPV